MDEEQNIYDAACAQQQQEERRRRHRDLWLHMGRLHDELDRVLKELEADGVWFRKLIAEAWK